ncbi:hypothetical protein K474DRAFT_1604052 [Panus rudis PR-1116 ss-1]|nr:hypothetical protein K474DRAFT_1604052 [Panus rudis PR-1116 ss-1]
MSSLGQAGVRTRVVPQGPRKSSRRVQHAPPPPKPLKNLAQHLRIQKFQRRWKYIKQELPPQLSRRHIGMISIGGVIGTGLFLGSGSALRHGGPLGALLGYSIIGTVVYCLCVSVGEMIAFLPNVGGIVGLADLYVDPALGFSLGWAAWYNWSVTLPAEVKAAAIVVEFWDRNAVIKPTILSSIFLLLAVLVNCFPSRVYGELEFWFSSLKVVIILSIIIVSLVLDLGAGSEGFIGFKYWSKPFASSYLGIDGSLGEFLGFWAVLMQASFSFFGSEVPGIAAGEVIDATRNVPQALSRVWLRITLFYVGGIFCAGLVVPANDPNLGGDTTSVTSSPFVIALNRAGIKVLPDIVNGAVLLSAWSAAASDVYISSRFLFFLAERGHAPSIFSSLIRAHNDKTQPRSDQNIIEESSEEDILDEDDDLDELRDRVIHIRPSNWSSDDSVQEEEKRKPYVLPLIAVLASSSVGLLSLLGSTGSDTSGNQAFTWLVAVASVASLQSWAGMLFTYIRWHKGSVYAEKKYEDEDSEQAERVRQNIERIKKHRHRGQPYLAWYAFTICMIILFTNGWSVFVHNGWKIAEIPGDDRKPYQADERETNPISIFLSSYIPIPFFLLLTFGYKLIHQTKMLSVEEMSFDVSSPALPKEEEVKSKREGIMRWLLMM